MTTLCPIAGAQTLGAALSDGQPSLDARLRCESADQDVPGRDTGRAATLRARLGYVTEGWRNWDAGLEFEGVWALNDRRDYNSLRNGAADKGVIADPTGQELNRSWLRYRGLPDTEMTYGRQRLILGNARFVGNVGWRQNEQTLTGLNVVNTTLPGGRWQYAWLSRAETVLFRSRSLTGHLFDLQQELGNSLRLTVYAYLLDFETDMPLDSKTLGLRLEGQRGPLSYDLEFARQSAHADSNGSPVEPDAAYYRAELGVDLRWLELAAGLEVLGGDDDPATAAFSTPLATLHKFQGWADVFLVTPEAGVEDAWLKLAGEIGPARLTLVYHRFAADRGSSDYGEEINAQLHWPLRSGLSGLLKLADYRAEGFAVDTRRIWAQLEYRF